MRWVILAVGVLFGAGTAWLVHRPVAPVEVVIIADANAGKAQQAGGDPALDRRSVAPGDERAGSGSRLSGQAEQAANERRAAGQDDDEPTPRVPAVASALDPVQTTLSHEAEQALAKWAGDGRSRAAAAALRKSGDAALAESIEAIDGLRRAGQGAFLKGELEEADTRWGEAILRERDLPLDRPSAASIELRGRLAAAWHDRALVHESRGQLAVAFAIWQRATAIDPSHLDSLAGLQRVAGSAGGERGSGFPAIPQAWPKPTDRP
jgi:hypothetical protein